jgi:hypothetical protein
LNGSCLKIWWALVDTNEPARDLVRLKSTTGPMAKLPHGGSVTVCREKVEAEEDIKDAGEVSFI